VGMNAKPVEALATAEVIGASANVCLITLNPDKSDALLLDSNAQLQGPDCAIYSNSTALKGIRSVSNAKLVGAMICSAGGYAGGQANFAPEPITDCPPIGDPLASRPRPPVGACDFHKAIYKDYVGELDPGVYCEGLRIDGNSKVKLNPGVYVIKDGEFRVDSNSKVNGDRVGFYLLGDKAGFEFTSNAAVRLSAPKEGPMAGLLFFEDRNANGLQNYKITSDYTDYLVGTIYLPKGKLKIDANQDVADESEFTVLVVNMLELKAGPKLKLHTNYGATEVPVPDGVGPNGARGVRLTE
jgi:hypothetical protein